MIESRTGLPWSQAETGIRGHMGPQGTTGLQPLGAWQFRVAPAGGHAGAEGEAVAARGSGWSGWRACTRRAREPSSRRRSEVGEGVVRGQLCLCSGWGRQGVESEEASGGSAPLEHCVPSSARPPAVPRCWLPTKRMAVRRWLPGALGSHRRLWASSGLTAQESREACGLFSARCDVRGPEAQGPSLRPRPGQHMARAQDPRPGLQATFSPRPGAPVSVRLTPGLEAEPAPRG